MRNPDADPAPHRPTRSTPRILVVDDDPMVRMTLTGFLADAGYQIDAAPNGQVALELVDDHLPTLILMDMIMPIMDGWTFVRELRARAIAIPIIVMTVRDHARAWAEEVGAIAYIVKPFDLPTLLATVNRHCP